MSERRVKGIRTNRVASESDGYEILMLTMQIYSRTKTERGLAGSPKKVGVEGEGLAVSQSK